MNVELEFFYLSLSLSLSLSGHQSSVIRHRNL